ncbi:TetR/AcrR family transcriptional regulator [Lentzea nigeriaca]|uniref:TetR/AcrR family transcriptional regulator n=1 Tax=Lentzea nigeriaca TaxID=1128665 RepID=UPI0027DBCE7F|nr:TetR family transcriptional regulator [Lentzea nigeriaca]MBM7856482.1 AcrR family transcriptional regulator [Lentzea nigeriaca]
MAETFQRARSEEQRAIRRSTILETASAMLRETSVSAVTLNELARRAGLAKSNVLRYFESREAVLLDLLTSELDEWLLAVGQDLGRLGRASVNRRRARVVAVVVGSLEQRPVLCDLLSAQAAVLERNISADVAARYKRNMIDDLNVLATIVRGHLPELSTAGAQQFAATVLMMAGAVWTHALPSEAMREAYARDPELASLAMNFAQSLTSMLDALLSGLLASAAG